MTAVSGNRRSYAKSTRGQCGPLRDWLDEHLPDL